MKKSCIRTELIYIFIKTHDLTKNQFCKMCKISTSTLKRIMEGDEKVSILAIAKIAKFMHLRLHQMFGED